MTERFNAIAKDWDKSDMRTQLAHYIGTAMLEQVPFHGQMHIMDFGAGTGLVTEHVAPQVQSIAAVDISEGMLEALAQKPSLQGKVRPRCQNILETPLEEVFDGIVSAMALHHVEDTEGLLRTFAEHLKPEGFVALADLDTEDGHFHPDGNEGVFHYGFEREALKEMLHHCGFEEVAFVTAHRIRREGREAYPIFLVTAKKGA